MNRMRFEWTMVAVAMAAIAGACGGEDESLGGGAPRVRPGGWGTGDFSGWPRRYRRRRHGFRRRGHRPGPCV